MHLDAKRNDYAVAAGELLDAIPKAVWAALAVSALTRGGVDIEEARERVVTEWDTLHLNGIVPQRVPGKFRHLINREEHS